MMMQMVGSFAEFEREMIRERTYAGIVAARAEGRIGGRRRKTQSRQTPRNCPERRLRRKSAAEMARLYDISQPTVSRIVSEYRVKKGL